MNTGYPYMNYSQPQIHNEYNTQDQSKQDIQGNVNNQINSNINYGNNSTKS